MFQLGAKFGVGRVGRDREADLDLAHIGGEAGAAAHPVMLAQPPTPKV